MLQCSNSGKAKDLARSYWKHVYLTFSFFLSNKNSKLNATKKHIFYEKKWSWQMGFLGNISFDAIFNTNNSVGCGNVLFFSGNRTT